MDSKFSHPKSLNVCFILLYFSWQLCLKLVNYKVTVLCLNLIYFKLILIVLQVVFQMFYYHLLKTNVPLSYRDCFVLLMADEGSDWSSLFCACSPLSSCQLVVCFVLSAWTGSTLLSSFGNTRKYAVKFNLNGCKVKLKLDYWQKILGRRNEYELTFSRLQDRNFPLSDSSILSLKEGRR